MQKRPKKNSNPEVMELFLKDLKARYEEGVRRYGVPLQPFNGRDALQDAYEEAIDLALYLRQALYERDRGSKKSHHKKEKATPYPQLSLLPDGQSDSI